MGVEKWVIVNRTYYYWEGEQRMGPVSGFSFDKVAPLELFERLVLRVYRAFGCFPDPHYEPVLPAYCDGPEDLAMDTITKFLEPDDDTVRWNAARRAPTIDGLLEYLERVMINDFLDRKRSKRFLLHATMPPMESDEGTGIALDELAKHVDTPGAIAQRRERHEQLIASFSNTPDLQDVLRHCHTMRLGSSRTLIKTGLSERAYTLNVNLVYRCQVEKRLVSA